MTQGVYCFHNQRHTYYQFTEKEVDKSSDEVGTALLDWIMDAKFVKKQTLYAIAHLVWQLRWTKQKLLPCLSVIICHTDGPCWKDLHGIPGL